MSTVYLRTLCDKCLTEKQGILAADLEMSFIDVSELNAQESKGKIWQILKVLALDCSLNK